MSTRSCRMYVALNTADSALSLPFQLIKNESNEQRRENGLLRLILVPPGWLSKPLLKRSCQVYIYTHIERVAQKEVCVAEGAMD